MIASVTKNEMERIRDNRCFAVKDNKTGEYFIGYNKWDKQLRKAKLYHSYKFAKEIYNDVRFIERETVIVRVDIYEAGECDYEDF